MNNKQIGDYFTPKSPNERRWSKEAKITTTAIFILFLALFPKYLPIINSGRAIESVTGQIFSLYFFIANQTLGIVHEGGHGVCYILPCPKIIATLNGTIFQLLFPSLIAYYYHKKGNTFAALIGVFFLGFSLYYTGWYIGTANQGPIVPAEKSFLGVDGYHDFYLILDYFHILKYYSAISTFTKFIAILIMLFGVIGMIFESMKKE